MDNRKVSSVLEEIALLLELKGENPFKVKAYSHAARTIEILEEDLEVLIREGRLTEIKGIGEALAQHITELVSTGRLGLHEDLKNSVPAGHLEMMKIPGLGPKKIKILLDRLHIKTVGELEYACLENRLVDLQGFGQKSQEKILQGVQQVKRYQGQYLYGEVIIPAQEILKKLLSDPKVIRGHLAGSLRRKREVVRNINLVISTLHPQEVLSAFSRLPDVETVQLNDAGGRYRLLSGIEVDLQIASERAYPYALFCFTGSSDHWASVFERAKGMEMELSKEGLHRNARIISCKEEEDVFNALGLDFIPPELRENQGEIEVSAIHRLPRLVEERDIKGIFHVHSLYSDGKSSIRRLAHATKEMGFSYLGLSDHSQSARYAGGLNRKRLQEQWEEIDQVNREIGGFGIFKGIESDILPDGSLDYEGSILREFDFVIASVHSHFNLSREEMTQRVIKAIRNPYTTMLAHPTGRLLLAREPYAIDMMRIIDEASRSGVAIELNAHPYRLDIDWRLCKYAKETGARIAINPDAHDETGLKDTSYGVGIGRKGWLEPRDILNAMDFGEMKAFLERRKPS
ncbi:MAG TPA: DNA polymerase/3'-5' exonuclease PolX [Thermodesulfobacteriota bacterium]|nr:DNA polymerase/3'-5' exonuclease PolX [Thermodesulfobacteriota bacterium]